MLSLLLLGSLVAPAEARVAYPCPDYTNHGCPCVDIDIWPSPCDEYRCDRSPWGERCERCERCERWPATPELSN